MPLALLSKPSTSQVMVAVVEQRIGITHLNGVLSKSRVTPSTNTPRGPPSNGSLPVHTPRVPRAGVGEADRVGDLITHLGASRTGLGDGRSTDRSSSHCDPANATGLVVKTFHITGDGGRVEQRIGITHLDGVLSKSRVTPSTNTPRGPPSNGSLPVQIPRSADAGVSEADRVGDLITHLGANRTGLGDFDRRIDQVHAVIGAMPLALLSKPSTSQVMVAVLSNGLGSPT